MFPPVLLRTIATAIAVLASTALAHGQIAPSSAAPAGGSSSASKASPALTPAQVEKGKDAAAQPGEPAIELSPFVVREGSDVGYLAGNTLAGSRLNTQLKDTAASIGVLTAEFLSDVGALSVQDAYNWMTNSSDEMSLQQSNDNNYFSGNYDGNRTRGIASTRTRNYFVWNQPSDLCNIERIYGVTIPAPRTWRFTTNVEF
jgi:hypothetical protein